MEKSYWISDQQWLYESQFTPCVTLLDKITGVPVSSQAAAERDNKGAFDTRQEVIVNYIHGIVSISIIMRYASYNTSM